MTWQPSCPLLVAADRPTSGATPRRGISCQPAKRGFQLGRESPVTSSSDSRGNARSIRQLKRGIHLQYNAPCLAECSLPRVNASTHCRAPFFRPRGHGTRLSTPAVAIESTIFARTENQTIRRRPPKMMATLSAGSPKWVARRLYSQSHARRVASWKRVECALEGVRSAGDGGRPHEMRSHLQKETRCH